MLLRSSWEASHISDPHHLLTLDAYELRQGSSLSRPVPLRDFIEYGLWFQRQVVPDLDHRNVAHIERSPGGFRVILEDHATLTARRVAVAAGIARFAYRPAAFDGIPAQLASHTSDHHDLAVLAHKRVLVVGAGQSAVESAALLAERGAEVEMLLRRPCVRWLRKYTSVFSRIGSIRRLMYPPSDVGPPILNRIVAEPELFKLFPNRWQDAIAYRCIRPAATSWLQQRVSRVRITTGVIISSLRTTSNGVAIRLSDGTVRSADHILLATGYRVDISRYPFLGSDLVAGVRCSNGYPELSAGFESSVPGLHFIGATAALSFGPVMRFVSGTPYTARTLTRKIAGSSSVRTAQEETPVWSERLSSIQQR